MKRKNKLMLLVITIITLICLSSLGSSNNFESPSTSSVDDYTAYLVNNSVDVIDDKYNLFMSYATSSNNYRNYYDIGEYYLEYTDNYSYTYYNSSNSNKYQTQQSYYEIDNDTSFKGGYGYDMSKGYYSDTIDIENGTLVNNGSMEFSDLNEKIIQSDSKGIETFESEVIGTEGTDIDYIDTSYQNIDPIISGVPQSKTLRFYDDDSGETISVSHDIIPTYSAVISFDIYIDIITGAFKFSISHYTGYAAHHNAYEMRIFHTREVQFYYNGGWHYSGKTLNFGEWYHIDFWIKPNFPSRMYFNNTEFRYITQVEDDDNPLPLNYVHFSTGVDICEVDVRIDNIIMNTDDMNYINDSSDILIEEAFNGKYLKAYINDTNIYNGSFDFSGDDYKWTNQVDFIEQYQLYFENNPPESNISVIPSYNGKNSVLEVKKEVDFLDVYHYLGESRKGVIEFNVSFNNTNDYQAIAITDDIDLSPSSMDFIDFEGIYICYLGTFNLLTIAFRDYEGEFVGNWSNFVGTHIVYPNFWQNIKITYDLDLGYNLTVNGTVSQNPHWRYNIQPLGNPKYFRWMEITSYFDYSTMYFDDFKFNIELIPLTYEIQAYNYVTDKYDVMSNVSCEYIILEALYYLSDSNHINIRFSATWNKTFYHHIDELSIHLGFYGDNGAVIYNEHIYNAVSLENEYSRRFSINTSISANNVSYRVNWYYNSSVQFSSNIVSYDTQLYPNETMKGAEIQTHIRHGLSSVTPYNTSYTCIMVKVYIFHDLDDIYNYTLYTDYHDFIDYVYNEVVLNGTRFTSEGYSYPNYDVNNPNDCGYYKGNYRTSYNSLYGTRLLKGYNTYDYNKFFDIPIFLEGVFELFDIPISPMDGDDDYELTEHFWYGIAFRTVADTSYNTSIGNWSLEFTPLKSETYYYKWYYTKETIKSTNIFAVLINGVVLLGQLILFLICFIIVYVFTWILTHIILILWNIAIYYVLVAVVYIIWYLWLLILWLFEVLLWIWNEILLPLLKWFWENVVPVILDWIIKIFAMIIAMLIWLVMLGQVDLMDTYYIVYDILWILVDFIYNMSLSFINNLEYMLLFIVFYVLCAVLLYFRYLVSRARGFMNKAKRQYYTFLIYIAPIVAIYKILKAILDAIPSESV